jgi:hypothetical protein
MINQDLQQLNVKFEMKPSTRYGFGIRAETQSRAVQELIAMMKLSFTSIKKNHPQGWFFLFLLERIKKHL